MKGKKFISKYPNGGKVKPIVVNDPNDPRLKAYNDSLNAYNTGEKDYQKYLRMSASEPLIRTRSWGNPVNGDDVIQPIMGYGFSMPFSEWSRTGFPQSTFRYKKPVQPVIYNPITKQTAVAEQVKPLYQAPQLTMPERLELSMNKPNVVQSAEGPTFKQGRKFMRESGVNKDTQSFNRLPGWYEEGGTINNMKRKLPKYSTGAWVKDNAQPIGMGAGIAANMAGSLIPDKTYTDEEGNDLGTVKGAGEQALEYGAQGLAAGAMFGPWGAAIGGGIGAGYGAIKGAMEAKEMREKVRMANIGIGNRKLGRSMTSNVNWGTVNPNTSTNMMFANGGLVLDYDNPNANAELELQETFQMPDGTVGNVDGPSHEMGGIAVDLPEGTRIWSDKLKHNGKTFAKHTKPITNKIAKLEKQLESSNNPKAIENSIMLLNKQLDHYFDVQESNKQVNEMKRTLRKGGMFYNQPFYKNGGIIEGEYDVKNISDKELEYLKKLGYDVEY